MFQTVFPSTIRSSKLHIQRQVFVGPLLLSVASLDGLAAGSSKSVWQIPDAVCAVLSSWWWTEKQYETCTASYRNKLWNSASCWLYSANILAMHGPMNVKWRKLVGLNTTELNNTYDLKQPRIKTGLSQRDSFIKKKVLARKFLIPTQRFAAADWHSEL